MSYIIALDQGTTSSRSVLYNLSGQTIASSAYEYKISYPQNNWVEQDPNDIWTSQLKSLKDVLSKIDPKQVIALGITNQRETIIAWDRETGEPLAPAIVWQCKRTANYCEDLKSKNLANKIKAKTGLTIDSYFSASKINWLIKNSPAVQSAYQNNKCVFGTVDSWLIFQLTKNEHAKFLTEPSNASRTMLYNIVDNKWDQELLDIFEIKADSLCEVQPSNSHFGYVKTLGLNCPITGVLGDQQSSLLGHYCIKRNDLKCTFGTGAFLLKNTGTEINSSESGLISTIAWQLQNNNKLETIYATEGSIFIAGSLIKWLRDKLEIISSNQEVENLAQKARGSAGLIIIPAFSGLGAPIWDPTACGAMFGITADTTRSEISYASLEAVAHQVADLLETKELKDVEQIKIDGGMCKNLLFNQILADITNREILVANNSENTVFGAFLIAGYGCNLFDPFTTQLSVETSTIFTPNVDLKILEKSRKDWKKALLRSQGWY